MNPALNYFVAAARSRLDGIAAINGHDSDAAVAYQLSELAEHDTPELRLAGLLGYLEGCVFAIAAVHIARHNGTGGTDHACAECDALVPALAVMVADGQLRQVPA